MNSVVLKCKKLLTHLLRYLVSIVTMPAVTNGQTERERPKFSREIDNNYSRCPRHVVIPSSPIRLTAFTALLAGPLWNVEWLPMLPRW